MTIDEAIKQCNDTAEQNEKKKKKKYTRRTELPARSSTAPLRLAACGWPREAQMIPFKE